MDPSIAPVLDRIAAGLEETLSADLVGLYVTGSAVTGDFEPDVSDLDLVVVTAREGDDLDLATLGSLYGGIVREQPDWVDRIEAVHVGRATLRSFRTSRGRLAVISPGEPLNLRSERAVEWTQNWWQLRESGIRVLGPEVRDLLPAIGWEEYADATRRYLAELETRDLRSAPAGSVAYEVLTACRGCATLTIGQPISKRAGAGWAIERYPDRAWLIEAALACRRSRGTVGFDDRASREAAAEFVRELIDEALAAA